MIDHDGFGGDIEIIIGINLQKEITGIEILSIDETVGLGMNAKNEEFRKLNDIRKTDEMRGFWLIRPDGSKSFAANYFDCLMHNPTLLYR